MKKIIVFLVTALFILNAYAPVSAVAIPSVESDLSPDIVTYDAVINGNNLKIALDIVDSLLEIHSRVALTDTFLTAFALRYQANYDRLTENENQQIAVRLDKIYNDLIANKDDYSKLIPNFPKISNQTEAKNKKRETMRYFAKDLFDLTSTGVYTNEASRNDRIIRVTFDLHLKDEDELPVFALCEQSTGDYILLSSDNITRNRDNSVTLLLSDFGEIIVFKKGVVTPPSPTGDLTALWITLAVISLLLIVFVVLFEINRRRNEHKKEVGASDNN